MIDPHASHFYQRDYFHLNFYLSQKSLKMLGGLKTGCDFKRKRLKLDKSIYELQFMFENFDSGFQVMIICVFTHSVRRWSCSPGVQLSVEPPGRRCRSRRCQQWWSAAGGENDEKRDLSDGGLDSSAHMNAGKQNYLLKCF